MKGVDIGRQLAKQGLKWKLRRVRYAKTKQKNLLNRVGRSWRLIDPSWLKGAFQKNIDDLEVQEKDILEKLDALKEPPED